MVKVDQVSKQESLLLNTGYTKLYSLFKYINLFKLTFSLQMSANKRNRRAGKFKLQSIAMTNHYHNFVL